MVDSSYAGLVKPTEGPVHRAGCVHCHMTSCLRPAGAQGHPLPAALLPVCTSHALPCWPAAGQHPVLPVLGRMGHRELGEQDQPQHCVCLGRGVLSSAGPPRLGFSLWSVKNRGCANTECGLLSGTRSGPPQVVAQSERPIFSLWDMDVPVSPRTELFCAVARN